MARDRARSSFTVEVKRGRVPLSTESVDPRRSLWRGLDLAAEANRFDVLQRDLEPTAAPARAPEMASPAAARGRILPSLIAPPEPVAETPAKAEPRPRVARASPVRRPRSPSPPVEAVVEARPIAKPVPAEPVIRPAETPRRRVARGDRVLRAGERWKRRLPRACW